MPTRCDKVVNRCAKLDLPLSMCSIVSVSCKDIYILLFFINVIHELFIIIVNMVLLGLSKVQICYLNDSVTASRTSYVNYISNRIFRTGNGY